MQDAKVEHVKSSYVRHVLKWRIKAENAMLKNDTLIKRNNALRRLLDEAGIRY